MNPQIRRLFVVTLGLFAVLGVAVTLVQFVLAPSLVADQRNARRYLQAAERDRGPIIVADAPVALSERLDATNSFQRRYPEGPLYSAATGYFSAVHQSATGIEKAENQALEGESSQMFWQRLRNLFAGKPRQGGGVVLTLDPAMQQVAADALDGKIGAAVAVDVQTGAVLTLYSSPSFDPNPLASLDEAIASEATAALEADPTRPLDNRAIAGNRYAPGSVFKILTSVAMLEAGVSPGTELDSPPTTVLPGTSTSVQNVEGTECGSGKVTFAEAFARSCNTTFVIASQSLPSGALQDVTERFGFGQPLYMPLSVTPSVFPENPDAAQLAMSAIGQFDVQVTPFEMAMVTATIANGGVMMQPFLVQSIVDADNTQLSKTQPRELGNPISASIANEITTMMIGVVEQPYGTGSAAAIPGIQVAAKTGTAETGIGDRTNAWTVAFAPADNPRIAVAVVVEGTDADPSPHGGDIAAPIVRQLLEVGLS